MWFKLITINRAEVQNKKNDDNYIYLNRNYGLDFGHRQNQYEYRVQKTSEDFIR